MSKGVFLSGQNTILDMALILLGVAAQRRTVKRRAKESAVLRKGVDQWKGPQRGIIICKALYSERNPFILLLINHPVFLSVTLGFHFQLIFHSVNSISFNLIL